MSIVELIWRMVDPTGRTQRHRDELGASLVEYTFLLVLILIVSLVAMELIGGTTANSLNNSGSSLFSP